MNVEISLENYAEEFRVMGCIELINTQIDALQKQRDTYMSQLSALLNNMPQKENEEKDEESKDDMA